MRTPALYVASPSGPGELPKCVRPSGVITSTRGGNLAGLQRYILAHDDLIPDDNGGWVRFADVRQIIETAQDAAVNGIAAIRDARLLLAIDRSARTKVCEGLLQYLRVTKGAECNPKDVLERLEGLLSAAAGQRG